MPQICCFFFSSRRRHTRLQGDWSSDVCSSDLAAPASSPVSRPLLLDGGVRSSLAQQRVPLWMIQRVHGQVDVEIWPVQVMRAWEYDVRQFTDRRLAKPGKLFERDKPLAVRDEQPESLGRDISDLNAQSAFSTLPG